MAISALTLQRGHLAIPVLEGNLQAGPLDQVKADAVRQLLDFDIRGVRGAELAKVVTLNTSLLLHARGGRLEGAQDEPAVRVEAQAAALPKQVVGELDVDVSDGYSGGRLLGVGLGGRNGLIGRLLC